MTRTIEAPTRGADTGAPNVVVAGGGFGGFHVAQALTRRLTSSQVRVILVNDENFLLYTPFMAGVAGGALEPRHIVMPLREALPACEVRVLTVEGAEPARNRLRVRNPRGTTEDLAYDQLVVCLGSVTRALPVHGLAASVFSGDPRRGEAVARRLEVGACCVNDAQTNFFALPLAMGGTKVSGFGVRHGADGIRKFCVPQALVVRRRPPTRGLHRFPYRARRTILVRGLLRLAGRGAPFRR